MPLPQFDYLYRTDHEFTKSTQWINFNPTHLVFNATASNKTPWEILKTVCQYAFYLLLYDIIAKLGWYIAWDLRKAPFLSTKPKPSIPQTLISTHSAGVPLQLCLHFFTGFVSVVDAFLANCMWMKLPWFHTQMNSLEVLLDHKSEKGLLKKLN